MGDGGKGSRPRPFSVSNEEYARRWDAIFQRDVKEEKKGTCGCGRSPTGDCIGWHSLNEEQLKAAREKWQAAQAEAE